MIPRAHIQAWSATTPWREPRQVEQDLIICRALCDIFSEPFLADRLAFRGGTAIHKLPAGRPDCRRRRDGVNGIRRALDAFGRVWFDLVAGLRGALWNKSAAVIDEFRATSLPGLLRTHA